MGQYDSVLIEIIAQAAQHGRRLRLEQGRVAGPVSLTERSGEQVEQGAAMNPVEQSLTLQNAPREHEG